jgi:hypothetical protein
VWVKVAGYEDVCFRPVNHDGHCLPLRSAILNAAERYEAAAQDIYDAVTVIDAVGRWPYEGPDDSVPDVVTTIGEPYDAEAWRMDAATIEGERAECPDYVNEPRDA